MIRLYSQQTLDRTSWNKMIDESANYSLFGQSWLLDIACKNWHALVMDDYTAGLVLPIKKKCGIKYAYNPVFIRECGVFSHRSLLPEVFKKFIQAVPHSLLSVDIFLNETLVKNTFTQRVYQYLQLDKPIESLRKKYNENTRRNIRKAEKQDVFLKYGTDAKIVTSMFLKNKLHAIQELKSTDELLLGQMLQAAIDRNQGFTVCAMKGNECISSAGFMYHRDTLLYFKGSVTDAGRKTGAMHFLMDQVLDKFTTKFRTLDFGGSNQPEVARFYTGLGGIDNVYYRFKRNWFL